MKLLISGTLAAAVLFTPAVAGSQEVAPFFEQAPMVSYETYTEIDGPIFRDYFEMLVEKYRGTDAPGWGLYRENSTVGYRITALPDRMNSFLEIQAARQAGFQEFGDAETEMWMHAWGGRHVALYNAAPAMSVVPAGFTVADIQELPYNRVTVYHLAWDEAPAFRAALRARSALDRAANIDGFVLTAWNGGLGTTAQTVMVRVSAENQAADIGPNAAARRVAREAYRAEFQRLSAIMSASAKHIERHDQTRLADLSHAPR